jgi:uncharacterized membrane protein
MEQESDPEKTGKRPATPQSGAAPQVERRAVTPVEFATVMVHFYRGEIARANIWRQRLDATFNWAVLTTGTTLSFAFGTRTAPHVVILFNSLLVAVFLFIEARRYRYYELWSSRVRVIETDYLAPVLSPEHRAETPFGAWSDHLAEDLLRPHFTVGLWEAVGRRLRRNYIWIFVLLALSWVAKIAIHPSPVRNLDEFLDRAAIGKLSGSIVLAIGFIYNGLLFVIALLTVNMQHASGEVLSKQKFRLRRIGAGRRRRRRGHQEGIETTASFKPVKRSHIANTGTFKPREPRK